MNAPSDRTGPADLAELALAIVLEDLKVRVAKAELTEAEAQDIVGAALERFPADAHSDLHALVDDRTAPDAAT